MTPLTVPRVLDARRCPDLQAYDGAGGGHGLRVARATTADVIIAEVTAAGLRGRGGAGFPTGVKWRTVAGSRSESARTTVVVNAAEGEPGTFKDRAILRRNPYRVLEGALIAAHVVGAAEVVVAMKRSFGHEHARVARAIAEMAVAGWCDGVTIRIVLGPDAYLFGEETGLLEVLQGRPPFPRVAPPFRRGVEHDEQGGGFAGEAHMAAIGGTDEPPALVDNVETLANIAPLLVNGASWFRSVGTERSPGTIVCTVTGDMVQHGVAEVAMGTPLRSVIERVGGATRGTRVQAVLSGVANPFLTEADLDTPLSYEAMEQAGSSLGACGFIVFDDRSDVVAVAQAVSRFLAVESCGQCEPCKRDGLELARALETIRDSTGGERALRVVADRVNTVARGARCFLAQQQERVVGSLLTRFPDEVRRHVSGAAPADAVHIAPIIDLFGGRALLDQQHERKQPDWTFDPDSAGAWPAARPNETQAALESNPMPHELRTSTSGVTPGGPSLRELRQLHRDVERVLHAYAAASPTTSEAARHDLSSIVDLYADVNRRIVYPMLRRVETDAGDDAVDASEETLARLLASLRRASPRAQILGLAYELLDHDEARVIVALRASLDPDGLDRVDLAIGEAVSTAQPAGSAAGIDR
jgi:NADH-quinone oxidoreductase subunit F